MFKWYGRLELSSRLVIAIVTIMVAGIVYLVS